MSKQKTIDAISEGNRHTNNNKDQTLQQQKNKMDEMD
jgi:hypothetical protein